MRKHHTQAVGPRSRPAVHARVVRRTWAIRARGTLAGKLNEQLELSPVAAPGTARPLGGNLASMQAAMRPRTDSPGQKANTIRSVRVPHGTEPGKVSLVAAGVRCRPRVRTAG